MTRDEIQRKIAEQQRLLGSAHARLAPVIQARINSLRSQLALTIPEEETFAQELGRNAGRQVDSLVNAPANFAKGVSTLYTGAKDFLNKPFGEPFDPNEVAVAPEIASRNEKVLAAVLNPNTAPVVRGEEIGQAIEDFTQSFSNARGVENVAPPSFAEPGADSGAFAGPQQPLPNATAAAIANEQEALNTGLPLGLGAGNPDPYLQQLPTGMSPDSRIDDTDRLQQRVVLDQATNAIEARKQRYDQLEAERREIELAKTDMLQNQALSAEERSRQSAQYQLDNQQRARDYSVAIAEQSLTDKKEQFQKDKVKKAAQLAFNFIPKDTNSASALNALEANVDAAGANSALRKLNQQQSAGGPSASTLAKTGFEQAYNAFDQPDLDTAELKLAQAKEIQNSPFNPSTVYRSTAGTSQETLDLREKAAAFDQKVYDLEAEYRSQQNSAMAERDVLGGIVDKFGIGLAGLGLSAEQQIDVLKRGEEAAHNEQLGKQLTKQEEEAQEVQLNRGMVNLNLPSIIQQMQQNGADTTVLMDYLRTQTNNSYKRAATNGR